MQAEREAVWDPAAAAALSPARDARADWAPSLQPCTLVLLGLLKFRASPPLYFFASSIHRVRDFPNVLFLMTLSRLSDALSFFQTHSRVGTECSSPVSPGAVALTDRWRVPGGLCGVSIILTFHLSLSCH